LVAEAELHIAVFYLYGVIQARESTADPVAVIEQQVAGRSLSSVLARGGGLSTAGGDRYPGWSWSRSILRFGALRLPSLRSSNFEVVPLW